MTGGTRGPNLTASRPPSTALPEADIYVSVEDYLAAEELSDVKHEYLAGAVYAMAGASRAHNQIAANLLRHLGNQLQGKPCAVLGSDMRLRIRKSDVSFYYYPNVTVDCSGSKKDEVEEPSVIFEVLSPATDRADRGDKLTNYHAIASMRVYVLVNQLQTPRWNCRKSGALCRLPRSTSASCRSPEADQSRRGTEFS